MEDEFNFTTLESLLQDEHVFYLNANDSVYFDFSMFTRNKTMTRNSRMIRPEKWLALILGTVSLIANFISLVAITKVRGSLTANLRLIVSLCAGDMMTSISILFHIGHSELSMMLGFDRNPADMCLLVCGRSLRMMSHVIALLNLVGLALDHYFAILRPLDHRNLLSHGRANAMIICFWIIAVSLGFSDFYIPSRKYSYCDDTPNICESVLCNTFSSEYIVFALSILAFILMLGLYTRIYVEIHHYQTFHQQHRQNIRRNRRGLVTTFLIVITFLLCWLPYSLFEMTILISMATNPEDALYYFKLAADYDTYLYDVLLLNTLCDPIIYAMRMREVQHGYKNTLQICLRKKQTTRRRLTRSMDLRSSGRISNTMVVTMNMASRQDSSQHYQFI